MIERKYSGRTRAFTLPEVLSAISHAVQRPARQLAKPSSIRPLSPTVAAAPAAELVLDDRSVTAIAGWSQAMVPQPALITVTRTAGPAVMVKAVGLLGEFGPTVIVLAWVDDWPFELSTFSTRQITASDLFSIALNALVEEETPAFSGELVVVR